MFSNITTGEAYYDEVNTASYKGICAKTFFLLAVTVVVSILTMVYLPSIIEAGNFATFYVALGISGIVGFAMARENLEDRRPRTLTRIY